MLKKLTECYPKHKIVVLPQTVYYSDEALLRDDMRTFANHKSMLFCARDRRSRDLLTEQLGKERVRLVPDMAFCIPAALTTPRRQHSDSKTLAIVRRDGELLPSTAEWIARLDAHVADWPTFYHRPFDGTFVFKALAKLVRKGLMPGTWLDAYCNRYFPQSVLQIGRRFIEPYDNVVTTRLHGCILAVLMGKRVTLLDNNYGKNGEFYRTWLADFNGVDFKEL